MTTTVRKMMLDKLPFGEWVDPKDIRESGIVAWQHWVVLKREGYIETEGDLIKKIKKNYHE